MTFDEWFNEIESFSLRCERFYNDLDHHIEGSEGSNKRMVEWLKAAYDVGVTHGRIIEKWEPIKLKLMEDSKGPSSDLL